ncbi:hypothetical protein ElyMa_000757700, partial [Elysia marginata]
MKADCLVWVCFFLYMDVVVLGQETRIHCLGSKKPLQLADPFPASEDNDALISMEWYFYPLNKTGGVQTDNKVKLLQALPGSKIIKEPRWEKYQNWGLALQDPEFGDTGVYTAAIVTTKSTKTTPFSTHIVVAEAPVLKSMSLAVSRTMNKQTGEVTLSCGTLGSQGTPPVELIWRAPNGSAIVGTYKKGNISLVLGKEEGDGTFSCEVEEPSPAMTCVPPDKLPLWEGKYKFDRHLGSSESNIIMLVVIVCCVIVVIIVIIVIVVLVKQKRKGEVYNA